MTGPKARAGRLDRLARPALSWGLVPRLAEFTATAVLVGCGAERKRRDVGFAMRVSVVFQDERLELDLPDENVIGSWEGPNGLATEQLAEAVRTILEHPLEFPAFRQMVVPGDRVAIALDSSLDEVGPVLHVLDEVFRQAGVQADDVTVVATPGGHGSLGGELPPGMGYEVHDPRDSRRMAYLATTEEGRRIYLNRHLTDADVVVPVGRLGYDPVLGYRGPWSVVFPELSDQPTAAAYRRRLAVDPPDLVTPKPRLDEPCEVSWLLGTQFHLGVVPGATGHAEVVAGLADAVRDQGIQAVDRLWSFQAPAGPNASWRESVRPGSSPGSASWSRDW